MPTFLTNDRMPPALRRRVEASVRHGRSSGATARPTVVASVRLVSVLIVVGAVAFLVVARGRAADELEASRTALLERVRAERALRSGLDVDIPHRLRSWTVRLAGPYEGDAVAAELRAPGALAAKLSGPLVYTRGAVADLASEGRLTEAAAASGKDAFLFCLLRPPEGRDEKSVLARVRVAYARGAELEGVAPNVARLHAALVGDALLAPDWERAVTRANTLREVQHLSSALDQAPLAEARLATSARLLLAVLDEPGVSTGLSEMDGERPHDVRIFLVDLAVQDVLLRLRRHVDPTWITPARRATHASGLDACALAMDVREAVTR